MLISCVISKYFNSSIGDEDYWCVPGTYGIVCSDKEVSNIFLSSSIYQSTNSFDVAIFATNLKFTNILGFRCRNYWFLCLYIIPFYVGK